MLNRFSISQLARLLGFATLVIMALMVLGIVYFFIDVEAGRAVLLRDAPEFAGSSVLSSGTIRSMLIVGLASVAVQIYLLWQAHILFGLYARRSFLSRDSAHTIRNLGLGLLILPVVRFVQEPIWSILMTMNSEDISLSIGISSDGIGYLIGGVLMLLIGLAMAEATHAAEENRGFV